MKRRNPIISVAIACSMTMAPQAHAYILDVPAFVLAGSATPAYDERLPQGMRFLGMFNSINPKFITF